MKKRRILICGNYGAGNFGDELILKGLLKVIKKLAHIEVTVMTGNEKETWTMHDVQVAPFVPSSLKSWTKQVLKGKAARALFAIGQADLIIFGGGGLFNEKEEASIKIWNSQVRAFRFFKKPVIMIGQSFGNIEKEKNKKIIRKVCSSMKKILVRDPISKKNLESLGIEKHIQVVSDSAFWLEARDFQEEKKPYHSPYYLISLRAWPGIDTKLLTEHINTLIKNLPGTPVFISMQKDDEKIFHQLNNKNIQCISPKNLNELWTLFSHAQCIIGMRLHACILATTMQKPLLAIAYDDKVKNLLQTENPAALTLDPHLDLLFPEDLPEKLQNFFSASNPQLKAKTHKAEINIFTKMLTKNLKSI